MASPAAVAVRRIAAACGSCSVGSNASTAKIAAWCHDNCTGAKLMINAAQIDRLAQPDCDGELLLWQASLVSYRPLALIKVLKSQHSERHRGAK